SAVYRVAAITQEGQLAVRLGQLQLQGLAQRRCHGPQRLVVDAAEGRQLAVLSFDRRGIRLHRRPRVANQLVVVREAAGELHPSRQRHGSLPARGDLRLQPLGRRPTCTAADRLPTPNLKPEQTTGEEIGADLGFLRDRVILKANIYQKSTTDQILPVSVSAATGYTQKVVNSGEVRNRGIELAATVTPIDKGTFR